MADQSVVSVIDIVFNAERQLAAHELAFIQKAFSHVANIFQKVILQKEETEPGWRLMFNKTETALIFFRQLQEHVFPLEIKAGIGRDDKQAVNQLAAAAVDFVTKSETAKVVYNAGYLEDVFINQHLLTWSTLLGQQSPVGRLVGLYYDLFVPIYREGVMDLTQEMRQSLEDLIYQKLAIMEVDGRLEDYAAVDYSGIKATKVVDYHKLLNSKSLVTDGMFLKGYATKISQIVDTSRQNIDYHIKNSQIAYERNLFATILLQIEREEE